MSELSSNFTIVNEASEFAQAFYKFKHENAPNPELLPSVLKVPMEEWLEACKNKHASFSFEKEDYLAIPKPQLLAANKLADKFGHTWSFNNKFLEMYQGPVSKMAITLISNVIDRDAGMGIHAPYLNEVGHIVHITGSQRLNWIIDTQGNIIVHINRPLVEWSDENGPNLGECIILAQWNGQVWQITPLIPERIEMRHIMALKEVIQVISGPDAGSIIKETFNDFDSFFSIEKIIKFLNESQICNKVTLEMEKSKDDTDKSSLLDSFFSPTEGYRVAIATYSYWLDSQQVNVVISDYGAFIKYPVEDSQVYSRRERISSLTTISEEDQKAIQEIKEGEENARYYLRER